MGEKGERADIDERKIKDQSWVSCFFDVWEIIQDKISQILKI